MKRNYLSLLLLFFWITLLHLEARSQESKDQKEFGLRIQGVNNFGLVYKDQRNDSAFTRITLERVSSNYSLNQLDRSRFDQSLGISIGNEVRRTLEGPLRSIRGPEARLGFSFQDEQRNRGNFSVNPGIGYLLGMQYDFNEFLYLNIHTVPMVQGTLYYSNYTLMDQFSAEFSVRFGFTFAYKW